MKEIITSVLTLTATSALFGVGVYVGMCFGAKAIVKILKDNGLTINICNNVFKIFEDKSIKTE